MIPKKYGAIFDVDGVLVDSTEAHFQAWTRLGEELGVPYDRELFLRQFGSHNNQIIPEWLDRPLADDELQNLAGRKEEIYRELAPQAVSPLKGAVSLVRSLAVEGFALGVASSGPEANVRLILKVLGLTHLFAGLSTGEDVVHGKPHPEVFLKAAERIKVDPERCVVVEDAPQGVAAARAAGMACLAVTSTRPAADLQDADLIVPTLVLVSPLKLKLLIDQRAPV